MKLSKRRRWNRISRSFRWKREKSNTSEGIPFFSKNFQWKNTFHLIYHRNNRFFRTKGKRPRSLVFMWSALGNIGWSGPDWSEFSDRPYDVIVRLITKKTNVWRWSALLSSALGDKLAGCQLCWGNYSSVCTLNDSQSSFFRGMD